MSELVESALTPEEEPPPFLFNTEEVVQQDTLPLWISPDGEALETAEELEAELKKRGLRMLTEEELGRISVIEADPTS